METQHLRLLCVLCKIFFFTCLIKSANAQLVKVTDTLLYPVWGIDISHYQGKVNWGIVRKSKPAFVIMKATEGNSFKDKRFDENYNEVRKTRIPLSAYHYFSYNSSAEKQAKWFIQNVMLEAGDLPPVLDLEIKRNGNFTEDDLKNVRIWIETIGKHYQCKPIVYVKSDFYNKYLKNQMLDCYLWIGDYENEPVGINWTLWQHSERWKIKGINGYCDRNVFNGKLDNFKKILLKK